MQKGKFNILVDSAWGSSAKAAASCRLVDMFGVQNVSSCNFPNAGHSFVKGDYKFVAKALPTPLVLNRFGKSIVGWVGPSSGFEIEQLHKELDEVQPSKVMVHERAVIVSQKHKDMERHGEFSTLHISSTMSGSGAAYACKAMRVKSNVLAKDLEPNHHLKALDPVQFFQGVRRNLDGGWLHEVAQGYALSVDYGTHWPHGTFRNCTPQQACADMGVLPSQVGDVYLNVRSFPIRVGSNFENGVQVGYSGDWMPEQVELDWYDVGIKAGMSDGDAVALSNKEKTTVTNKIRRVATPSWELLKVSAEFCGATKLILNFPQYIEYSAYRVRGGYDSFRSLSSTVREYVDKMEEVTGLPVVMLGTGADHDDYIYIPEGANKVGVNVSNKEALNGTRVA